MSANSIAHLANKQAKQLAKLELAEKKRQGYTLYANGNIASGPDTGAVFYRARNTYDITQLPTEYSGVGNGLIDNPNTDGLIAGRPWLPYNSGVYRTTYSGYFDGNTNYFATATITNTQSANNFYISTETVNTSEQFLGYIRPNYTGSWTFTLTSDDKALLWIGSNAISNFSSFNSIANTNVSSSSVSMDMVTGQMYPIRLQFGNGGGPGFANLTYSQSGQIYYNRTTNGF